MGCWRWRVCWQWRVCRHCVVVCVLAVAFVLAGAAPGKNPLCPPAVPPTHHPSMHPNVGPPYTLTWGRRAAPLPHNPSMHPNTGPPSAVTPHTLHTHVGQESSACSARTRSSRVAGCECTTDWPLPVSEKVAGAIQRQVSQSAWGVGGGHERGVMSGAPAGRWEQVSQSA